MDAGVLVIIVWCFGWSAVVVACCFGGGLFGFVADCFACLSSFWRRVCANCVYLFVCLVLSFACFGFIWLWLWLPFCGVLGLPVGLGRLRYWLAVLFLLFGFALWVWVW